MPLLRLLPPCFMPSPSQANRQLLLLLSLSTFLPFQDPHPLSSLFQRSVVVYRDSPKGLYMVARIFFLLLLICSCLGPAKQNMQAFQFTSVGWFGWPMLLWLACLLGRCQCKDEMETIKRFLHHLRRRRGRRRHLLRLCLPHSLRQAPLSGVGFGTLPEHHMICSWLMKVVSRACSSETMQEIPDAKSTLIQLIRLIWVPSFMIFLRL